MRFNKEELSSKSTPGRRPPEPEAGMQIRRLEVRPGFVSRASRKASSMMAVKVRRVSAACGVLGFAACNNWSLILIVVHTHTSIPPWHLDVKVATSRRRYASWWDTSSRRPRLPAPNRSVTDSRPSARIMPTRKCCSHTMNRSEALAPHVIILETAVEVRSQKESRLWGERLSPGARKPCARPGARKPCARPAG